MALDSDLYFNLSPQRERFASIKVLEILEDGRVYGNVEWAGRIFKYHFPYAVGNYLSLKEGDNFFWYPQKRDIILPEDCVRSLPDKTEEIEKELSELFKQL